MTGRRGTCALTAAAQEAPPGPVLSLYRTALALRRTSPAVAGEDLQGGPAPGGCLAFRRAGGRVCLLDLSGAPVPLPEGRVLLASAGTTGGVVPDDAVVWRHPWERTSSLRLPGGPRGSCSRQAPTPGAGSIDLVTQRRGGR